MMPDTRARTSETRVGAIRPGNSRTRARGCERTVKVPTSGSAGFAAAVALAACGSLQPVKSGAIAVNIKMMHADRVGSPDIESIAPVQVLKRELSIRDVVVENLGTHG